MSANAVIAQSGGPTAVINQSLIGCVEALRGDAEIEHIYGARHGVRGMLSGEFIDLGAIHQDDLERLAELPSAALGSTRDKPDADYCARVVESLARHDIRYLFYVGGNDSADTCRIVDDHARRAGTPLRCFHIPKTIDNDLVLNDHCPGYGSAARYVALMFFGDNLDNQALPGIKINVVMGRHAGFLTAASALARRHDEDGPHLICLPERTFDPERFVEDVDRVYSRLGRCQIAISEGIRDRAGNLISAMMSQLAETDQHGNIQLSGTGALGDFLAERLRQDLGQKRGKSVRVRSDTLGYAQRSFPLMSPVDRDEAREAGNRAGLVALEGAASASIIIRRVSNDPYRVEYGTADLERIAGQTRRMPEKFIDEEAVHVTDAFLAYARPLAGDLPRMARL